MEGRECASIAQLKLRMRSLGVTDSDLDKFQDEIDDEEHDLESIKEDISDREQSMLVDFFRDECEGGEPIYDILFEILIRHKYEFTHYVDYKDTLYKDRKYTIAKPKLQKQDIFIYIDEETLHLVFGYIRQLEQSFSSRNYDYYLMPHSLIDICAVFYFHTWNTNNNVYMFDDIKIDIIPLPLPSPSPSPYYDSNPILTPGVNIMIQDEVLTSNEYLESIDGITKVLKYSHSNRRLPYSFIQFWYEFLEEEPQIATFKVIAEDIMHNEGTFYDYLMEHPPNDRLLPCVEEIVNLLRYPVLDSNKDINDANISEKDVAEFFKQQLPGFWEGDISYRSNLIKTCIMMDRNTGHQYFNIFELFINVIDVYDRILYYKQGWLPFNITQSRSCDENDEKHHFASKLTGQDCIVLNDTLNCLKDRNKNSFFAKLENVDSDIIKINGSLRDYQLMSLSFMLFIKSFICESGNDLQNTCHKRHARRRKAATSVFKPNIDSLCEIKKKSSDYIKTSSNYIKRAKEKQRRLIKTLNDPNAKDNHDLSWIEKKRNESKHEMYVYVDEFDVQFSNDNMPLQFDFVIIPKDLSDNEQYNDYNLEGKYDEFNIESKSFTVPKDKNGVYQLYGDLVEVFRNLLKSDKSGHLSRNGNLQSRKDVRKDDRYCVIMDMNVNKFYIYAPHFDNGEADGLKICGDRNEIENRLSYISHDCNYNDLTNLYLTSKCIIPSKCKKYYGIEDMNYFCLSAHFHKQRQWFRHPNLRMYQYFNGGGMRFFHKNYMYRNKQKYTKYTRDMTQIWSRYFTNINDGLTDEFIDDCEIFDAVLDLYKCDREYFKWNSAVIKQIDDI